MIDPDLFIRGHIDVRINDNYIDDYDVAIVDHYFEGILGLKGEVLDGNGSAYELIELTNDDNFDIIFEVDAVEYQTIDSNIVAFETLTVRCTGHVIQMNGRDVLNIETYKVTDKT